MNAVYRDLFPGMWLVWAAYWWIAARRSKRPVRRESPWSRLSYAGPLVAAALLLELHVAPLGVLNERFLPAPAVWFWIGALLTVIGLLFSVWARHHLGGNWSGTVTIKQNHELISSGPYALVRHPIYSGLLLALLGSALACGEWRAALAVALATASFWRKLQIEERWLGEQFGAAYADYRRRVPALIPFLL